jgi:hypothetical protein
VTNEQRAIFPKPALHHDETLLSNLERLNPPVGTGLFQGWGPRL